MNQIHDQLYLLLYGGQVEVEATVRISLEPTCDGCVYGNHETTNGKRVVVTLMRLANQVGHPVGRTTPLWRTAEIAVQKLFHHNQCVCERHHEAFQGDVQYALEGLNA